MTATEVDRARSTATRPVRAAISDSAPFALALVPFGLAIGAASAAAGLSATTAVFGAIVLLAGAAQLAAIEILAVHGGIVSVVVVVALVNLRFVFYGAGIATWFDGLPLRRRLLLAFPVVDQTFMLCQQRFADECDPGWRQRYYLASTAVLAGTFVACQVIAYRLGAHLPDTLGLHLAAPLVFTGMLAHSLRGRVELVAGAAAAVVAVGGATVLGRVGLPLGVLVGVAAGCTASRRREAVAS